MAKKNKPNKRSKKGGSNLTAQKLTNATGLEEFSTEISPTDAASKSKPGKK